MKLHTRYECLDTDGDVIELSRREEKHLLKHSVGGKNGWVVAAAIVVGAVIDYQSQKKAGEAQQEGIQEASRTQAEAADRQLAELQRQYNLTREDFAPFRETGLIADEQLRALFSGEEVSTPLANVLAKYGEKSVTRQASAQGFLNTGQQKLALQRAGQEAALQGSINPLLVLSGRGQAATGSMAGAGSQYAGNVTNVLAGLGAAQGQAALLQGQARASTYQGYGNTASNALNQYMQYYGYNQGYGQNQQYNSGAGAGASAGAGGGQ